MLIAGTVWRQDVATRACTGMCAVWRVPVMSIRHTLRIGAVLNRANTQISANSLPEGRYRPWSGVVAII